MIVSMLAVLKAGGSFVAIDPDQPMARTKTILDQLKSEVVLCSPACDHVFTEQVIKILHVDNSSAIKWPTPKGRVASTVMPRNAAYNIFTSGSTGTPKGIIVEHRSFCSGVAVHAPAQFMDENSRVLQFASYTHDTSLAETLTTLLVGGTVCTPSSYERKNSLPEFVNQHRINWAVLTPTFLTSMSPEDVPTLEVVVLAGERLSQSNIHQWVEGVKLLSGYGVSECSVCTTISKPLSSRTPASNIGLPAGGVCWITDPQDPDCLMPIGEMGEILIEGPTVARGYMNNLNATKKAFIDAPKWLTPILESKQRNDKLYRTGDLGRQNGDGTLDFVSRLDSQVKIAGRRIELGEIEHHVSALDDVRLCMVVYTRIGPYSNELVAVVQLHAPVSTRKVEDRAPIQILSMDPLEEQNRIAHLSNKIRDKAPNYIVPAVWLFVRQFPTLPSAKLDRPSVVKWVESLDSRVEMGIADSFRPSTDPVALAVAVSAAEVMNRPVLRPTNDSLPDATFASNGLDSIKAITLMRILQKQFGVKIPVEHLLNIDARPTTVADVIRKSRQCDSLSTTTLDLETEQSFHGLRKRLQDTLKRAGARKGLATQGLSTVFLTGATGYLGQDIMRLLLCRHHRVIILMRASSLKEARKKIVARVKVYKWWSERYDPLLEIWLGDLSKPSLGLSEQNWATLRGQSKSPHVIDAVIHNGAIVHWTEGASSLWPVNVESTVTLLDAALESESIRKFVYVSGGAHLEGRIEEQIRNAPDGYTATKLIGQGLVECIASESKANTDLRMSTVKPGFIIGNRDGFANPRDYLWRLVASVLSLGIYDQSTEARWIGVSTSANIATKIADRLSLDLDMANSASPDVEDGLCERELWDTLKQHFGYTLHPVTHREWVKRLQDDLEQNKEAHMLWPLFGFLEAQDFGIGRLDPARASSKCSKHLREAIISNVEHLRSIDFLPQRVTRRELKRKFEES